MNGIETVLYFAALAAIIFAVWAQIKVSSTFRKYSRVSSRAGLSAAQVARIILDGHGLGSVRIERVGGNLTDHYDPRSNTLRLSDGVYDSDSAAAVGVAAHEAGHAIQHAENYLPIVIRTKLVPVTSFASRFTWIVIILGSLFMMFDAVFGYYVFLFGIGLFAVTTLFQLVTLPCEFDASRRALLSLRETKYYSSTELAESRKVLNAAALTYVAALLVSILQLLRLIVRVTNRRR